MKKEKEKKVKEKKVKEKAVSEPKPEGRVREFLCGAVFSLLVGVGSVNIALVGLLFCFLYGFPQLPLVSELSTYHTSANALPQGGSGMSQSNSLSGSLSSDSAGQSSAVQANTTPVSQGDETPKQTAPASGGNQQEAAKQQPPPSQTQTSGDDPSGAPSQLPEQSEPSGNSGGNNGNADNFNTYDNSDQQKTDASYVLNTNSRKFHYPSCNDVKKIAPQNYETFEGTRDEAINAGYSSCGHCNP